MRWRFKSMLTFIFILTVACGAVGIGYLFYHEVIDSDIVVDGDITINYVDGKRFKSLGDYEMHFSITNRSEEQKYYYISFNRINAKDVTYYLESSDNLKMNNKLKSDIISNQVTIDGNKTVEYTLKFKNNGTEKYSGIIEIGLRNNEKNTFADVILSNNKVSEAPLTKFGEAATLDEGLLAMQDDTGISYYFRGAVTNNNVEFADLKWKIVRINGDGSIKLVLNDILPDLVKYSEAGSIYEESLAADTLEAWFKSNLLNVSDYIAHHQFCDDTAHESDNITYAAYNRIMVNKIPTNVCLGDKTNYQIGLLTADEVMLAGGSTTENKNYYLYNDAIKSSYFTMTSAKDNNGYQLFSGEPNGSIGISLYSNAKGIRPVINIIKNAKVSGDGTSNSPYKIIEK